MPSLVTTSGWAAPQLRRTPFDRTVRPMLDMLEVMDKEPSLRAIWGAAVLLGVVGYVATRFRRWLVLPALALVGLAAWTELGELLDPQAGPAIMQGAGMWYVAQAGAAIALAVLLCVLGLLPKRAV